MPTLMEPRSQFDQLLDATLQQRAATPPAALEQRLLARLANETPHSPSLAPSSLNSSFFQTASLVNNRRSSASLWGALLAHAAVFLVIFALAAHHIQMTAPKKTQFTALDVPPPPPPAAPKAATMGGGGGTKSPTPVAQGHLPKFEEKPLLPPKAPPLDQPKLALDPAVNVQSNMHMADNNLPNLGLPTSNLPGASMGNGNGTGLGSGNGNGIGPGSGGNIGSGVFHIGGAVLAPKLLVAPEPEFSEEARKAKFSGDVQVYLIVDENGRPTHVKVVRGVGMGLDDKAIEAVRQYKFKPAVMNGKPVKVDLYVNVNFQIF